MEPEEEEEDRFGAMITEVAGIKDICPEHHIPLEELDPAESEIVWPMIYMKCPKCRMLHYRGRA